MLDQYFLRSLKNKLLYVLYLKYAKTFRLNLSNTASTSPVIFAVYHEFTSILIELLHRLNTQYCFCILVSNHQDGDLLERVSLDFGLQTFRIRRNLTSDLRKYLTLVKKHRLSPVLAVDGPSGPYRKINSGVLFLQRQLNLPIQIVGMKPSCSFRIGTWDRHLLPIPWSKINVYFSKVFFVRQVDKTQRIRELQKFFQEEEVRIKNDFF